MKALATALAQFQAIATTAPKDSKGNYGTYTSLAAVISVAKEASAFGLCHVQTMRPYGDEFGHVLTTTLMHTSGEQLESTIFLPAKSDGRGNYMQALGSALTYARRYALLAIYGLASDDDDGQSSSAPVAAVKAKEPAPAPVAVAVAVVPEQAVEFLDPIRKAEVCAALKASPEKLEILAAFKENFQISSDIVSPSQIQLPAHADFIAARLGG
jgi:hypothetical protein